MTTDSHPKPKYGTIFVILLAVTIIEIFAANIPASIGVVIMVLVGLAILKATLVAMFYMHLKFEKLLLVLIAVCPLLFSIILVLVVGADLKAGF